MPVVLPPATSRSLVRGNGERKLKRVAGPLSCRPDADVGNFSASKQRGSLMIHHSGNLFQQSQPRRRPMRLNSCANRYMRERQDREIFADRRQNADICRIRGLSGVRRLLVRFPAHSFLATGITNFLENDGHLEAAVRHTAFGIPDRSPSRS